MVPQRFKSLPADWQVLPFVDAVQDKTSGNPKIKSNEYQDEGVLPVVDQGQSTIAGYVDDPSLACGEETPCIVFGDHTKIFKYIEHPFALGADGVKVLAPKAEFDKRFLFHYLNTVRLPDNAGYSRHFKFLKETWIPQPPLKEQKRIAAILDKADAIRRKRQQAIQLADEFLRSVFLDMFGDPVLNPHGWDEMALDQIATIRSGVTKGRKFNGKPIVMLPYMRVANVQDGKIDLSDVQSIDLLQSEVDRFLLKSGDLLLTEGGDPDKLGRGAVWHGEISPCVHQNHIFAVRANQNIILPEFLSTQIGSQRGKRYFLKVGKQTTGIATINKTVLSSYPALVPPIQLQQKYVGIVERMRRHTIEHKKLISLGTKLFQSIRQQAFQGEL